MAGKNDMESKYINKRINDNAIANNNMLKGEMINGKVV